MKKFKVLATVMALMAIAPNAAHAYLDPGTGSMVIQIIVASLAAIGVFLKSFWAQIKAFFVKGNNNDDSED